MAAAAAAASEGGGDGAAASKWGEWIDSIQPRGLLIALLYYQGVICKIITPVCGRLDPDDTRIVIKHPNDRFATLETAITHQRKFRDRQCTLLIRNYKMI